MKFHTGDIVQFTGRGDEWIYIILGPTEQPQPIDTSGEAYFYDALELIGDDGGATIGIVVDDWNRENWRVLA
jgi:hypothetical protein